MNATLVASSSPMFSPFGQAAQSAPPATNPFASQPAGGGNPFGLDGAGDSNWSNKQKRKVRFPDPSESDSKPKSNPKPNNPFQTRNANLGDGGKSKKKWAAEGEAKGASSKGLAKPFQNSKLQNTKQHPSALRQPTVSEEDGSSRPTSSSSVSSADLEPTPAFNANDPHARKVYECLRRDGISPPQWPSQPGNPKNKAAMAKFREQYEAYRDKVRASLTRAGLIDDPDKRKALRDAIDFKGICEDMCPEFEKITRITEADVYQPEKNRTTTFANTSRMVKKLARSAAGQEAPLPMDVRSVPALRRTLDYLLDNVLRNDGNLPVLHGFLWDRTRAIRRDFSFFSSMTPEELKTQVYILENIARFHVTALHLLSQEGKAGEDFVEQQELEQLGKSLLSLRDLYDDCNGQDIHCENEPEFRAYYLIFHAYDSNMMEVLQRQWKPSLWRDSDDVRTAVSLVEALQNTQDFHGPLESAPSLAASSAHHSYFRIVDDPKVSYTMACFAECHFPQVRRSILRAVKRALARPKESTKDVTAAVLNKFLRFDTIQQAISFAELHDLDFRPDEQHPTDLSRQYLVLNNKGHLPHPRLQHQFSRKLVEKKRGTRPLPDLIHTSVYEDPAFAVDSGNGAEEESLFVQEPETQAPSQPVPFQPQTAGRSPFASFGVPTTKPPPNGFGAIHQPAQSTLKAPNSSKAAESQSTPKINPFAPKSSAVSTFPATNPFADAKPATGSQSAQPFQSISAATPQVAPDTSAARLQTTPSIPPQPAASGATPFGTNPIATAVKPESTQAATSTHLPASSQPTAQPKPSPFARESFGGNTTTIAPPVAQSQAQTSSLPQFTPSSIANNPTAPQPLQPATVSPSQKPFPNLSGSQTSALKWPPTTTEKTGSIHPPSSDLFPKPSSAVSPTGVESATPAKALPGSNTSLQAPKPVPSQPVGPPRDLLGDFTKWIVEGDKGLLAEFQVFMLENIVKGVFDDFVKQAEETQRREEEERDNAAVKKFRVYNLSLRYFYKWKNNAREKRLKALRRTGREQMRAFYKAQQAAHSKSQHEAANLAVKKRAEIAALNRPEEFMGMLKHQKVNKRQAERDLLASGVLSGVNNEREAISSIVRGEMPPPPRHIPGSSSQPLRSSFGSRKGGAKTRALREEIFGEGPGRFRRSLPPMSRESSSPDSSRRVSGVSERWRLKAMGIVQLPDGTAVPEFLANEMAASGNPKYEPYWGRNGASSRRASVADITSSQSQPLVAGLQGGVGGDALGSAPNKRKRSRGDEGGDGETEGERANSHKRVMSDAEKLIGELRALREEMEEGATWFKSQNERMQSEITSRGGTPWDESSI